MHVLLTNGGSKSLRGLWALRSAFISTGMNVLTVVSRTPSGTFESSADHLQIDVGGDVSNPIVHGSSTPANCVRDAIGARGAGNIRLLVSGIQCARTGHHGRRAVEFAAAVEGARRGLAALYVTATAFDDDVSLWRTAELAAELAALMYTEPRSDAVVHLDVPSRCQSLRPVLLPELKPRYFVDDANGSPIWRRGLEVAPAIGRHPTLRMKPIAEDPAESVAAADAWLSRLLNQLLPRLVGSADACGCCAS